MSLFLLYPIWCRPTVRIGLSDSDVYKHVWGHWWVRHMILSVVSFPFSRMCSSFQGAQLLLFGYPSLHFARTHRMDRIGAEL